MITIAIAKDILIGVLSFCVVSAADILISNRNNKPEVEEEVVEKEPTIITTTKVHKKPNIPDIEEL